MQQVEGLERIFSETEILSKTKQKPSQASKSKRFKNSTTTARFGSVDGILDEGAIRRTGQFTAIDIMVVSFRFFQ